MMLAWGWVTSVEMEWTELKRTKAPLASSTAPRCENMTFPEIEARLACRRQSLTADVAADRQLGENLI
jgi:hypothetical protein